MTGGLIQLVAYGEQDMFITHKPQITFFKMVYRRHTNFSIEQIPQVFTNTPNFGKRVTCILSKSGDLVGNIILSITLPSIPQIYNIDGSKDNLTKYAWIKKIGFGIIKEVEIEIGGQLIDRHYGEWINIWMELTRKKENIDKMMGNIPELYSYTSTKNEYIINIPLQFWFCREYSMAIPILCLQYNDVKINLELSDASSCFRISPTHYIVISNDEVNFTEFEYIYQTIGNYKAYGIFSHYDTLTKRLYYVKISANQFIPISDEEFNTDKYSDAQRQEKQDTYAIHGHTSGYYAYTGINTGNAVAHTHNMPVNIRITKCILLVNYIFLDEAERKKFYRSNHEYMIDQLIYTGSTPIDGINRNIKVGIINPCKLIAWTVKLNENEAFNYTDDYIIENGASLVDTCAILFNGRPRMNTLKSDYYNYIQPLQHFDNPISTGINIYSFSLVHGAQPSGSCNMSKIDNIQISMKLSSKITTTNIASFKCYGLTVNMFKIASGIGGVVFTS